MVSNLQWLEDQMLKPDCLSFTCESATYWFCDYGEINFILYGDIYNIFYLVF
jgi:hypothetical protein